MSGKEKDEHVSWNDGWGPSNDVELVDIVLTNDLFLSYRRLIIWFVLCGIQEAAKQIIAFFYFIRIPASFDHFLHVFLFDAWGMDDTCVVRAAFKRRTFSSMNARCTSLVRFVKCIAQRGRMINR